MASKKKQGRAKLPANPIDRVLGEFADRLKTQKASNLESLGLMEFITAASPFYRRPEHLAEVIPILEKCERKPQFFSFSAPPRHGKSVIVTHFCAWMMIRNPGIKVAYCSYGEKLSFDFSDQVKDIILRNGYEIAAHKNSRSEWEMVIGSHFRAISVGSPFTGMGADIIVIDDPYKSRMDAASGAVRERVLGWFRSVAITRRSPKCSVVLLHTRWENEDLIGFVTRPETIEEIKKDGTVPVHINKPAIDEQGNALWPSQYPIEKLLQTKGLIGEFEWASLFQGSPRPKGGAVFNDVKTYSDEEFKQLIDDKQLKKYSIGIDLAYTKKSSADYSVAVVLAIMENGNAYVVDMRRKQVEAKDFAATLRELRMAYNGATIHWYVGGQEKVIATFFRDNLGIPIKEMPAKEDKFARAQPVAAAWNSRRVLMPCGSDADERPPAWTDPFLSEVLSFSGLDDPHDDIVDALAAAFVPMQVKAPPRGMSNDPRHGLWG